MPPQAPVPPAPKAPAPPVAPAPPAPPAPKAPIASAPAAAAVPVVAVPVAAVVTEEPTTPLTVEEIAAIAAVAREQALSTDDVSQANAATGVYGDSGTGKTSQACTAIEYCWETFHQISHFYAADLGGYGNYLIRLAKLGLVKIYHVRNHVEPFETAELISMGYFPERIQDPITGYADEHVRLIPPQVRRWTVFCNQGHAVETVTTRKRLDSFQRQCPTCKQIVTMQNWSKVEEQIAISPGFKHVGLRIYDSGTSLQDWVMEDLAGKAAREEFSEKNALKGAGSKVISGDMVFGSNSMQHFGFAQNRMPSWIANSRRIPRNAVPPIWTFLEQRGKDEGNITIFGPKIAGNARTSDVPAWLGNCLHLAKEMDQSGVMVNRMYLSNHSSVNEGNIPHLAKHRGDAGTMPTYLQDDKDEPAFTKCSLKYFFIRLEAALKVSLQSGVQQYPDAPALHAFTDDLVEEVLSTTTASLGAPAGNPTITAPIAGGASGAAGMPGGASGGIPMGVPLPPPSQMAGPVPVAPMPAAPAGMAVPQAVAAGTPGPRPPVPAAQSQPPQAATPAAVAQAQPAATHRPAAPAPPAPAARPAPPAPAPRAAAPVSASPAPVAAAPPQATQQAAPQPPGGAPVRPPATSAVSRPRAAGTATRPPVPPPPGPTGPTP